VGVDLGIKDFAVTSDGEKIANPRHVERKDRNLVLEDLAVANMVRNHSLAKAISDCGWATFRSMAEYRAERYGRHVITADRWFPSSKTCSACGHLLADLSLSTRHWTCPSCGTRHDRDINAAKNILAAGLAVARSSPCDACGADVSHSGSSRVQSAVKQEPRRATAGIPVLQGGE
jgi:putative transposase